MSHINRAIVQIPAFFLIAGVIVVVNWVSTPEVKAPPKNPKQLPAKIVIEHAQEEIGRIRAELESIKENGDYAKVPTETQPPLSDSTEPAPPAPM